MECPQETARRHQIMALALWALGSGFALGLGGCVTTQSAAPAPAPNPFSPPSVSVSPIITPATEKDANEPKKQPKASTCLAYGDFNLQAAGELKDKTAGQREEMLDTARRAYQQALKLDATCTRAYSGLARAYEALGDHRRAVETFQNALQDHPKDAGIWYEMGMCQARAKDWNAAIASLRNAVDHDVENRLYRNTLAFTLARAGQYDESFAIFQQTVGDAQAHFNLARMFHHARDDESSKRHLALALQLDPKLTAARQMLAEFESAASGGGAPVVAVKFEALEDGDSRAAPAPNAGSLPR